MKKLLVVFSVVFLLCCVAITSSAATYAYEREGNNNYTIATPISLGSTMIGTINDYGDVDFYRISPPGDGKLTLTFSHKYSDYYGNVNYGWYIETYIFLNGELKRLNFSFVRSNDKESVQLPPIGARAGTQYYVKIDPMTSTPNDPVGVQYQLQAAYAQTPYYEKEFNNSYPEATVVALNKTYTGTITDSYDVDYYKITAPTDGKLTLTFQHKYSSESYGWAIEIYQFQNGGLNRLNYSFVSSTDKESIKLPAIGAGRGAQYYVAVTHFTSTVSSPVGVEYKLKNTFTIPGPSSLKVSALKTTSLQLSWSKVSGVTGYVLYSYNAKTGKTKQIAATRANGYQLTGLKPGTVYRFTVKAYRAVNGTNYFSSYSSVLTTATKPLAPKVTARAASGKAYLSWNKVAGATGYVVYYSLNQKSGYKKLATTKQTSCGVQNLVRGTTYYFIVRTYKKVNGKTLYSGYSNTLVFKAK